MKRLILLAATACLLPYPADADEPTPRPPLPSPALPPAPAPGPAPAPAPALTPMPAPAPRERATPAPKAARPKGAKKPSSPTIVLKEKRQTDEPHQRGAGIILPAKFQVEADRGRLSVVLAGASQSSSFYGLRSDCVSTVRLVQELEIVPGDPGDPRVSIALSGKVEGYLRGEKRGTASLRRADAAIYPADGDGDGECDGEAISWVAFPPVPSPSESETLVAAREHAPPVVLPAGRYVLVATLVLETTAVCPFRDHGAAVFAPSDPKTAWIFGEENPFEEPKEEDFGLSVVLRTAMPSSD